MTISMPPPGANWAEHFAAEEARIRTEAEHGSLRWTTEPPTVPGFYWEKRHPGDANAYVSEVRPHHDGTLRILGDVFPVAELGHMWFGPLKAPT